MQDLHRDARYLGSSPYLHLSITGLGVDEWLRSSIASGCRRCLAQVTTLH